MAKSRKKRIEEISNKRVLFQSVSHFWRALQQTAGFDGLL
jgi:hypothetical protein